MKFTALAGRTRLQASNWGFATTVSGSSRIFTPVTVGTSNTADCNSHSISMTGAICKGWKTYCRTNRPLMGIMISVIATATNSATNRMLITTPGSEACDGNYTLDNAHKPSPNL